MPKIFHAVDTTMTSPRHKKAREKCNTLYGKEMSPVHVSEWPRTADLTMGDRRPLPYIKDLLGIALSHAQEPKDVIIWTNGDNGLHPQIIPWANHWVVAYGTISMRRDGPPHYGRDLFAFTAEWLTTHWSEIPDYILGAPDFDLGLACQIRAFHKITTPNLLSLEKDIAPADSTQRLVTHAPHRSEWMTPDMNYRPSTQHNRRLFRDWASKHHPHLRFGGAGFLL